MPYCIQWICLHKLNTKDLSIRFYPQSYILSVLIWRFYLFILYSSLLVVIALLSSLCINILHRFCNYQTTKLQLHFLKIFLLFLKSPSGNTKIAISMYESVTRPSIYLFHLVLFCPYSPQKQRKNAQNSTQYHSFSAL